MARDRREVTRIATAVFYTDRDGVDWRLYDRERGPDGRMRNAYPGLSPRAIRRVFVRRRPDFMVEHRSYPFRKSDSRTLTVEQLELQLEEAMRRP